MRVGVDARLLSIPLTGIGRYTAELSRALLTQGDEFFLYMPSPPVIEGLDASNVRVRSSSFRGRAGKMAWSQTILPYSAIRDSVDVFWGATHRLPRYLPQRIARVVTIHDLVWKYAGETMRPLSRWTEERLMPEAIRLADRIMADSQSTADGIEAEFPSARGKVRVVYLGTTPLAEPDSRDSLKHFGIDRPYFLFVGTLEPRKNLRRLLGAFARVPEGLRKENMLVIAGGKGWGRGDVNEVLVDLGLKQDVIVTGYVTDAQLATLYAHARFLAMPSLYEGFGLPLVEAMSCGVPVLTSNTSSLPEVAGDAGCLVDPMNENEIADGLSRLLADDKFHDFLAARTKMNAARFTWQKAAIEAKAVFAEALEVRRHVLATDVLSART